jgi:hypothetical protein
MSPGICRHNRQMCACSCLGDNRAETIRELSSRTRDTITAVSYREPALCSDRYVCRSRTLERQDGPLRLANIRADVRACVVLILGSDAASRSSASSSVLTASGGRAHGSVVQAPRTRSYPVPRLGRGRVPSARAVWESQSRAGVAQFPPRTLFPKRKVATTAYRQFSSASQHATATARPHRTIFVWSRYRL